MIGIERSKTPTGDIKLYMEDIEQDGLDVEFYGAGKECALVEINIYSETGCAVLTGEQARQLAYAILEETGGAE